MNVHSTLARSVERSSTGSISGIAARLAASLILAFAALAGSSWFGTPHAVAYEPDTEVVDVPTSAAYQQFKDHENDPNTFVPGDVVTIPYVPRAGDKTPVDGRAPVALRAGTASGASMADSDNGTVRAVDDALPADGLPGPLDKLIAPQQAQATPASGNVLRREVFGFLPYWESVAAPTLNYDLLSTVAYFGVGVDGKGNLQKKNSNGSTTSGWGGWTSSWMTGVINNAHAHGTRVVLTIEEFAWTTSERQEQANLLNDAGYRLNAAQQIAAAVSQRGADGVNLDFEPIASTMQTQYRIFVQTLRTELDKIQPGMELTFCGTGSTGYYDIAGLTAPGAADAVFIMGYDFRTGSSSIAGSIDPLTSPMKVYDLTQVINLWKARTSVSHIILGLPLYGIAWTTVSNAPNAATVSGSCLSATSVFFAQAASVAAANGRNYDSVEHSAWTTYQLDCPNSNTKVWRELYYDDAQSLAVKYDAINYWGLRGMGIWALGYDAGHPEIPSLIANKFLTDQTPPKTGIKPLADKQSSEGFEVSWTGYDDWNGIANYDVQVSTDGGPFKSWLTATTATSDQFEGNSGHNYSFRVRATDGAGNIGPWDVDSVYAGSPTYTAGGFIKVTTSTLNERSGPSTSSSIISTVPKGTVLQIMDGPVTTSDNVTWFKTTGPFSTVNATAPVFPGLWVAVTEGSSVYAQPITPPNSTAVSAAISGYHAGETGLQPSGTGIDRGKLISPDGDGIHDTLPVTWTNITSLDTVTLTILRLDGSVVATVPLGAQSAGPQSFTWDGKANGSVVPDGQYILQITGVKGSDTFFAPSPAPFGESVKSNEAVYVDTTPTGTYYAVSPERIVDSRVGLGIAGALKSGVAASFGVAGVAPHVPANAIAITGNLTVTRATAGGYVRVGSSLAGSTSTINFPAGDDRANGITMALDPNGKLSAVYRSSSSRDTVHMVLDLTGYFVRGAGGATFVPITPTRIVDTREKNSQVYGALAAGRVASFNVAGLAGVPSNAVAVTGNATVTATTGGGYVSVDPNLVAGVVPGSSTINFPRGDIRANNVTVPLSGGKLSAVYVGAARTSTHFVFDVTGYFVPGLSGATFVPLDPGRLVDSRVALGYKGPLRTNGTATFAVANNVSVKPLAIAAVGNLTVTAQTSYGWLAVGPARVTSTSTLNFPRGDNRANGFVCMLGPGGDFGVTFAGASGSTTQIVMDILGYYR